MDGQTNDWRQRTTFVGFDWAGDHHDVVVVDQYGAIIEDFRFDDTAEGWQQLAKTLGKHPDPAVVIETSGGMTVQRLLEAGLRGLSGQPQGGQALSRAQSAQRQQDRPPRCLEPGGCVATRRAHLAAAQSG